MGAYNPGTYRRFATSALGRRQSGFAPATAPERSLTFHLTKPRLLGIVSRQACVRGRKGAAHAEPATVRPPLPPGVLFQQNVTAGDRSTQKDVILYRSKPECV